MQEEKQNLGNPPPPEGVRVPSPEQPPSITPEQILRHYNAAMDSVNLINQGKPEYMSDEEWVSCLQRNKEHLKIVLSSPYWTDEDLTPLRLAAE